MRISSVIVTKMGTIAISRDELFSLAQRRIADDFLGQIFHLVPIFIRDELARRIIRMMDYS